MKYKAVLSIEVFFENFSSTPEEIKNDLKNNVGQAVGRGQLTEGLDDVTVETWSVSVETQPVEDKMKATIRVNARLEDSESNSSNLDAIRSTINGLADFMANQGLLSNEVEIVDNWSSEAEVEVVS